MNNEYKKFLNQGDSQIGAKDGNIFFVHLVLGPSAELCFVVESSQNAMLLEEKVLSVLLKTYKIISL